MPFVAPPSHSEPGRTWPVHRALADYLACGQAAPLRLEISAPLRVAAWAREGRLALANLTAAPVRLEFAGRTFRLPAHGWHAQDGIVISKHKS